MVTYDYSNQILSALGRVPDIKRQQFMDQQKIDADKRSREFNLAGALAGLLSGGLKSGKLFNPENNRIDLSGLLTQEAGVGLMGGASQLKQDSLKDLFTGGYGGMQAVEDLISKPNREQSKIEASKGKETFDRTMKGRQQSEKERSNRASEKLKNKEFAKKEQEKIGEGNFAKVKENINDYLNSVAQTAANRDEAITKLKEAESVITEYAKKYNLNESEIAELKISIRKTKNALQKSGIEVFGSPKSNPIPLTFGKVPNPFSKTGTLEGFGQ